MPFLDETASAPLSKMGAVLARSARGLAVPRPGPVCLSPPSVTWSHFSFASSLEVGGRCPPAPASPPTRRPPLRVLCLAAPTFGAVRCSPRRNLLGFRLASCGTWRRSCRGPPLRRHCASRLPAPGRDCLSGYLVLCKLFIRVL